MLTETILSICLSIFCFIVSVSVNGNEDQSDSKDVWDLIPIDIKFETTNSSLIDASGVTIKQFKRGQYGFSGSFYMQKDYLDDDVMIDVTCYYNAQNNDNLRWTPLHFRPHNILHYVNVFYKKHIMPSLKNCSNAPQFEGTLTSYEILANNFTFENCMINSRFFSNRLQPGYYLVKTSTYRTVPPVINTTAEFNFKVEETIFD